MKTLIAILVLASVAPLRADEAVSSAQQTLKDQGFYYGQITGEKNSDTTAAIRRYQIRNGLQITGELNDETLQSLRNAPAATPRPAIAPAATSAPRQPAQTYAETSDSRDATVEAAPLNSAPVEPSTAVPPDRGAPPIYQGRSVPTDGGMFAGTPFANSPPDVQQRIIADAQKILARRGLFKNAIDGTFGPDLEFSLRAYQSRVGLRPTGQLDLETLAALELLPGAHEPIFTPRRGRPAMEPPVRGEWVRP
jgi:peptidoglycan hydrolase-like protein with peptidoglycan-binding domain